MANVPDWDDVELKGVPYERNSAGEAFKIWEGKNSQGVKGKWHVYKNGNKTFMATNPRPDGNVIAGADAAAANAAAEAAAAQAQAEQQAADARRIAQQQEDARIMEAQQRAAAQQQQDQQVQEDARMMEAQAAEVAAANQSQTPETPAQQDAPPAAGGGTGVTSVSVTTAVGTNTSAPEQTATPDAPPPAAPAPAPVVVAASASSGGGGFPTTSSYQNQSVQTGSAHTVVKGDTMWDIARANDMKLAELVALNPQIENPRLIYPGQKINLGNKSSSVLGASTEGGSAAGNIAADPARVPMSGTTAAPDPFNGSQQSH